MKKQTHFKEYFYILLCAILISGCGGGSVSSVDDSDNASLDIVFDDDGMPQVTPGDTPGNTDDIINRPQVSAGERQFSDANVITPLNGTASAIDGNTISGIFWQQVSGPEVVIVDPRVLQTIVLTPDLQEQSQVELRLTVRDNEGNTNSATTVLFVSPVPSFARVVGGSVNENADEAIFTIILSTPQEQDTTINFGTIPGTALPDEDYLTTNGDLIIEAGALQANVSVPLVNNIAGEGDESFSLQINVNTPEVQAANSGVVVIRNNPEPIIFEQGNDPESIIIDSELIKPIDNNSLPGDAVVLYSSSNPAVATVDSNGIARALSVGQTVISARLGSGQTDNEEITNLGSYLLTVTPLQQTISFQQVEISPLLINEILDNPIDAESIQGSGTLTYTSSNPSIATVDNNGQVTGLTEGQVIITANLSGDTRYAPATATYSLDIVDTLQTLRFVQNTDLTINALDAIANPIDPQTQPLGSQVIYESSDPEIADVDSSGVVQGITQGVVIITASIPATEGSPAQSASYQITVEPAPVALQFEQSGPQAIFALDQLTNIIDVTTLPPNAIVSYASSNTTVAQVDANGVVSGLTVGTTIISASIPPTPTFAGASINYALSVEPRPQPITFNQAGPFTLDLTQRLTNPVDSISIPNGTTIEYTSSDLNIATVDNTGLAQGLRTGTVIVTASRAETEIYAADTAQYTLTFERNIAFENTGPQAVDIGQLFDNAIDPDSAPGNGTITYTSSDNTIAAVDTAGQVTTLLDGQVTISATKQADDVGPAQTQSYTLTINPTPETLLLSFTRATTLSLRIGLLYGAAEISWGGTEDNTAQITLADTGRTFSNSYPTATSDSVSITFTGGLNSVDSFNALSNTFDFNTNVLTGMNNLDAITMTGNVTGDIANLPPNINTASITGTNTVSGDILNLPPLITSFSLTGQNTIMGDIQNIPDTLTNFVVSGLNTISGDVAGLHEGLISISISGRNTLAGDIQDIPDSLTGLTITGSNTITGNLLGLHEGLTSVNLSGLNTLNGDIQAIPDSLTTFFLNGQNAVNGNIIGLHEGLTTVSINGRNSISGDIQDIPDSLTNITLGGMNMTTGDISGLHENLVSAVIQGNTAVTGDIAGIPDTLTSLFVDGTNTITGDISGLHENLIQIVIRGNNTLSGDIQNLPSTLVSLITQGQNTLTGDIASVPASLSSIEVIGDNTLFGDIQTLRNNLRSFNIAGRNTISGNIANLHDQISTFILQGENTIDGDIGTLQSNQMRAFRIGGTHSITTFDISAATWQPTQLSTFTYQSVLSGSPSGLGTQEVDTLLEFLARELVSTAGLSLGFRQITIDAPRTQGSDIFVLDLQNLGYSVTTTNISAAAF